jgi:FkbM family methyltransferase
MHSLDSSRSSHAAGVLKMTTKPARPSLHRVARRLVSEIISVANFAGYRVLPAYLASLATGLPTVLRDGTLQAADRGLKDRDFEARVFGQRLKLAGCHFSGAREMYGRKVYFALPDFRLHQGDVVIDLGANAGLFTLLAARTGARVVAVEAQSGFIPVIRDNLRANSCESNAEVEWALVGGSTGALADPAIRRSASHYVGDPPMLGLNELVSRHDVSRIDFLKIDIEGSEFDLFSRDLDWLSLTSKIALEVHPSFGDPRMLVAALTGAGFMTWLLDNGLSPVDRLGPACGYLYGLKKG